MTHKVLALNFWLVLLAFSCTEDPLQNTATNTVLAPETDSEEKPVVEYVSTSYKNPLLTDIALPDPDAIRAADGYFYLTATEAIAATPSKSKNIPIMRSSDMVNWTKVGSVFTDANHPHLNPTANDQNVWAPSINRIGSKYVIYYSMPGTWISEDGSGGDKAIGVAVSDKPEGPYTDKGELIRSYDVGLKGSIDPFFYKDASGRNYMYWGSFAKIGVLELSSDGHSLMSSTPKQDKKEIAEWPHEGSVLHKHGTYYYLILSAGTMEKNKHYHLVVGRSTSPTGPFLNKAGVDLMKKTKDNGSVADTILRENSLFLSPGHCSKVITDDTGQDWILYHAWPEAGPNYRCLMLDKVNWVDGWPIVNDGTPSTTRKDGPRFKKNS